MSLHITKKAAGALNRSILICGTGRSGTSIVGKIVSSLNGIEYAYEPPMLFSMLPLIENLDENTWKLLFETYLYEDFFLNHLAGRNLNFNENDESCILKVKSKNEVEDRLRLSYGKKDLEEMEQSYRLAVKVPEAAIYASFIKKYYPGMTVILITRNFNDTINSVIQKKWFQNEMLESGSIIWPNTVRQGKYIPFWVKSEDYDFWNLAQEVDRAAYYYIRMYEDIAQSNENITVINYENLIENPKKVFQKIIQELNCEFGTMTDHIIGMVKKSSSKKVDLTKDVSRHLLERAVGIEQYFSSC